METTLEWPTVESTPAPTTGRLPDFLIIGAAKAGTTTLRQYLSRHPQLCLPRDKEPEFFADKFSRGWDWYTANFAHAEPGQLCGEASPIYTWWQEYPTCAARVGKYLRNAKLIYILRHPVERTYSQYGEQIKSARAKRGSWQPDLESFETFVRSYEHFVWAGEYIRFIEEYRKYFSADAFLFLFLDELRDDPRAVLRKICHHLGVDENVDLTAAGRAHGKNAQEQFGWQTRLKMTRALRAIPGIERLGSVIPRSFRERTYRLIERTRYGAAVRQQVFPPLMLPETRVMLLERFHEPNRRLAEYLGCDLSHGDR